MRWTPEDFAEAIGAFRREVAGMVRRMTIGAASGSIWQMLGHALFDPTSRENKEVEVFSGIGFFARPEAGSSSAEGIVVDVGGANGPAVIATRDEAIRALVDDIEPGEACVFNRQSRVVVKKDGTIEIRTHGGTARTLLTVDDFAILLGLLNTAGTGSATAIPAKLVANYAADFKSYIGTHAGETLGTSKLKGE